MLLTLVLVKPGLVAQNGFSPNKAGYFLSNVCVGRGGGVMQKYRVYALVISGDVVTWRNASFEYTNCIAAGRNGKI